MLDFPDPETAFNIAEKELKLFDVNSTSSEEMIAMVIEKLNQASDFVDRAGLLSANEEIDDCPTGSLKFLFLPYYIGKAHYKSNSMNPYVKAGHLSASQQSFLNYLKICEDKKIMKTEDMIASGANVIISSYIGALLSNKCRMRGRRIFVA